MVRLNQKARGADGGEKDFGDIKTREFINGEVKEVSKRLARVTPAT